MSDAPQFAVKTAAEILGRSLAAGRMLQMVSADVVAVDDDGQAEIAVTLDNGATFRVTAAVAELQASMQLLLEQRGRAN